MTDSLWMKQLVKRLKDFTWQSTTFIVVMFGLLFVFMAMMMRNQLDSVAWFMRLSRFSYWPLLMMLAPTLGGLVQWFIGRKSCNVRDTLVIATTFVTIGMVFMLYPAASQDGYVLTIPKVLGFGLNFTIDMLGFTMLLITSILWFLVMVYAHEYMKIERHCNRFLFFMALTYASVLGTIMAGDLLTMFLFFEMMTLTSYMLVVHGQKQESLDAGYNYIFMGLIGGFAILIAIILLYVTVGDLRFVSAIEVLSTKGSIRYVIIAALVFGFGIKAGMAPVHVWLPRAHPVAPTPASALLSGIMIKVGAFGILRVATSYYFPPNTHVTDYLDPLFKTAEVIGTYIIWLGIITMAIGVFFALQQSNIKTMLAYHSVSQMGYIVLGIGVALYLGMRGAMGYSGALYHIINHALFKSLLFMVAGAVYLRCKQLDMYKLGGLWRHMPLTAAVCLVAVFGISGVPLFNGFISKSMLHHGIVESYQYGASSFRYAEWIFNVISAGTVCSFIKLYYYVFLGKQKTEYNAKDDHFQSLHAAMLGIALLIVIIGLNPRVVLDYLITPALHQTGYDAQFINKYIVQLSFFTFHEILTMVWIIIGGFLLFVFGTKFHWFHLNFPGWFRLEFIIFYPLNLIMRLWCNIMKDQCKINPKVLSKTALIDNEKVGFLERFTVTASVFNKRYENIIIKSDATIYTLFITVLLIYMLFFT